MILFYDCIVSNRNFVVIMVHFMYSFYQKEVKNGIPNIHDCDLNCGIHDFCGIQVVVLISPTFNAKVIKPSNILCIIKKEKRIRRSILPLFDCHSVSVCTELPFYDNKQFDTEKVK